MPKCFSFATLKNSSRILIYFIDKHIYFHDNFDPESETKTVLYWRLQLESFVSFNNKRSRKNYSDPCLKFCDYFLFILNRYLWLDDAYSEGGEGTSQSLKVIAAYKILCISYKLSRQFLGKIKSFIKPYICKLTKIEFNSHYSSRKAATTLMILTSNIPYTESCPNFYLQLWYKHLQNCLIA